MKESNNEGLDLDQAIISSYGEEETHRYDTGLLQFFFLSKQIVMDEQFWNLFERFIIMVLMSL